MSKKAIILSGILLFILLAILCVLYNAKRIESNLLQEAQMVFSQHGLPADILEFDGRDAILTGEIGSEELKNKAVQLLSDLPGVRKIHEKLTIASEEQISPSFTMRFDNGKLILDGKLPNQEILDQLLDLAAKKFGTNNIINKITIDGSLSNPAWLSNLPAIFNVLADHLKTGAFSFDGITPTLSAGNLTGITLEGLLKRLQDLLPAGVKIATEELTTKTPAEDIMTTAMMQQRIDELLKKSPLHFDTDSDVISSTAMNTLKAITDILNLNNNIPIAIVGHADSRGTQEHNQKLSERRATSVAKFLQRNGILNTRMSVIGMGENKPIADNSTAAGQQKNRRVEINIKEGN